MSIKMVSPIDTDLTDAPDYIPVEPRCYIPVEPRRAYVLPAHHDQRWSEPNPWTPGYIGAAYGSNTGSESVTAPNRRWPLSNKGFARLCYPIGSVVASYRTAVPGMDDPAWDLTKPGADAIMAARRVAAFGIATRCVVTPWTITVRVVAHTVPRWSRGAHPHRLVLGADTVRAVAHTDR